MKNYCVKLTSKSRMFKNPIKYLIGFCLVLIIKIQAIKMIIIDGCGF